MIKIKKFIWGNFPKLTKIYGILFNIKPFNTFTGWGMTTTGNIPPWSLKNIYSNKNNKLFLDIHNNFKKKVMKKKFILQQYNNEKDLSSIIDGLRWRHYVLFWSSLFVETSNLKNKVFVECGVADGMSIYYSLSCFINKNYKFYLYDSWSGMSKKYLNYHEKKSIGKYNNLDFDQTKKNLKNYQNKIIFNKGYINKDFKKFSNPKKVNWLSIDLNSSQPTLDCLNFFYKLMEKNGIIIFDDYGSPNYVDTKKVVDKFFKKKKEQIFQLPTGQAIVIKI
jgi:hypothetical protein